MWAIVILVAALVLSRVLAPKPPKPQKPASLEEFDAPIAEAGVPIPVVFGEVLLSGPNVVWYGDLSSDPIKSKGGKK
jgi:hypothetical protein